MKKYILILLCLFCAAGAAGYLLGGDEAKSAAAETTAATSATAVPAADKAQEQAEPSAPANLAAQYNMDADFILIRKGEFKLYAVNAAGEAVAVYGCALGKGEGQKQREGDMKTPNGTFVVDEILDASYWTHDFKDGKGEIKGAYGPWFISLDTTNLSKGAWGGIGIHGTHDPSSIGTRASEGCIRLHNEDIEQLKKFAKVGMKVVIEE